MKIKLELFGASREFSQKDYLELEVQNKASTDELFLNLYSKMFLFSN